MIFCDLCVLVRKLPLDTQRKSLRKFNLRLLATTCESVWPGLEAGSISGDLLSLFYAPTHPPPLRGRSAGLSDSNFDLLRTIRELSVHTAYQERNNTTCRFIITDEYCCCCCCCCFSAIKMIGTHFLIVKVQKRLTKGNKIVKL